MIKIVIEVRGLPDEAATVLPARVRALLQPNHHAVKTCGDSWGAWLYVGFRV